MAIIKIYAVFTTAPPSLKLQCFASLFVIYHIPVLIYIIITITILLLLFYMLTYVNCNDIPPPHICIPCVRCMHVKLCCAGYLPMQDDGSSCAVFTCAFAELLTRGLRPPYHFSQVTVRWCAACTGQGRPGCPLHYNPKALNPKTLNPRTLICVHGICMCCIPYFGIAITHPPFN